MINGLGVVGWGVGGIEAEAVMLGQPIYMLIPEVIGFRSLGPCRGRHRHRPGAAVTEMLRKHGVVDKFVEFYGPGLAALSLPNRATIANMAPEYGATMGFFPVDEQTLLPAPDSGRDEKLIGAVEAYCKLQGLWRDESLPIKYTASSSLDLSEVQSRPRRPQARPQDRILLRDMKGQVAPDRVKTYGRTRRCARPPSSSTARGHELKRRPRRASPPSPAAPTPATPTCWSPLAWWPARPAPWASPKPLGARPAWPPAAGGHRLP
jgi:aconitate hydratase